MKNRVVITGIGPITSAGIGAEQFWKALIEKNIFVKPIPDEFDKKYKFKSRFYIPFPEFSLHDYHFPSKFDTIMEENAKTAILGTKLAFENAGFEIKNIDVNTFKIEKLNEHYSLNDICIILGVGMSSLETAFKSHIAHAFDDTKILEKYNARYNRMVIPMLMPNSASAWISIIYGLKGCNYTLNAACASGTYAIGEAYEKIKNGSYKMAITGGVECLRDKTGSVMRGFDTLNTLTKSENGLPMPFSKKRSGFLFSEGAGCILILEEMESAIKRNAPIYAEVADYQANSDAFNIVQMDESGENIEILLRKIVSNNKIDYINAHGTATIINDDIEAKIIQKVFGNKENQPFINSTKSILGHSLGPSGALEVAVTALTIKHNIIHGNLAEDIIDNLNVIQETTKCQVNCAISTSYGFGGHNAAILLKKFNY